MPHDRSCLSIGWSAPHHPTDGIPLLYSNSQGRGVCHPSVPPSPPRFHSALSSFLPILDSSETSCSAKSPHPQSYPIITHDLPRSRRSILHSLSLSLASSTESASLPPFPVDPPATLHIQRLSVMWPELDRYECIVCLALYNETYITCLLTAVTDCLFSCLQHEHTLNLNLISARIEIFSSTWWSGTYQAVIWSLTTVQNALFAVINGHEPKFTLAWALGIR